jgi:hypothetical protein
VRDRLLWDPLSGHVFLFSSAQHNRLNLLFWDGSGLCVCAKRELMPAEETVGEESRISTFFDDRQTPMRRFKMVARPRKKRTSRHQSEGGSFCPIPLPNSESVNTLQHPRLAVLAQLSWSNEVLHGENTVFNVAVSQVQRYYPLGWAGRLSPAVVRWPDAALEGREDAW